MQRVSGTGKPAAAAPIAAALALGHAPAGHAQQTEARAAEGLTKADPNKPAPISLL